MAGPKRALVHHLRSCRDQRISAAQLDTDPTIAARLSPARRVQYHLWSVSTCPNPLLSGTAFPRQTHARKKGSAPWILTLRNGRLFSATGCATSSRLGFGRADADYKSADRRGRPLAAAPGDRGAEAARAQGRGPVEPVHAAGRRAASMSTRASQFEGDAAHQPRICALRRGDGADPLVGRGVQLLGARHRQYGGAPPLRHARAEGAVAARR